jgi:hypothetical protein
MSEGRGKAKMTSKRKITQAGQPCRHCEAPVIKGEHQKSPAYKKGGYYFLYWFQCPKCKTFYMVEAAKRYFDATPEHDLTITSAEREKQHHLTQHAPDVMIGK